MPNILTNSVCLQFTFRKHSACLRTSELLYTQPNGCVLVAFSVDTIRSYLLIVHETFVASIKITNMETTNVFMVSFCDFHAVERYMNGRTEFVKAGILWFCVNFRIFHRPPQWDAFIYNTPTGYTMWLYVINRKEYVRNSFFKAGSV
jgi:hypothetical protein